MAKRIHSQKVSRAIGFTHVKLFGLFGDEMRYVTVLGSDESFGNVGIMGIGMDVVVVFVVVVVVLINHA